MGRLLKWVMKQEQRNRNSGVRDFVVNYYKRNVNSILPVAVSPEGAIEAIDHHWESGALRKLEIDALMAKISSAWRTKSWTDNKSAKYIKRVGWLTPEVNKIFTKMLEEWGLEVGEAMTECILRANEDFGREKRIRKEVREEFQQRLSSESDKAKKAILRRSEALKSVPITARQELRELRLEVGSIRAKLANAMLWLNNDYMQMDLDCRLDSLPSAVENDAFPISIAKYSFSIDDPIEAKTRFDVKPEECRGYLDDINMDSLK